MDLLDTSPSSGEPAEQSPFALRIFALAMTAAQDELEIDIVGDRHDASSPVVAKAKASRAALFAALSSAPSPAQVQPSAVQAEPGALHKFYGVTTDAELIDAQARHIEGLQAKLPAAPSFAPTRVREG